MTKSRKNSAAILLIDNLHLATIDTPRSIDQWAVEEIIVPNGPCAGQRLNLDYIEINGMSVPVKFTKLIMREYMNDYWRRIWMMGSVQSGKTFFGLAIPLVYKLFEMRENCILCVPQIEMAQEIFNERIKPTLEKTMYADLMPETGRGSRGGQFKAIQFGNGVWLRFMGAGGGDEQRSSFTAKNVFITEVDKMDTAGQASKEADPLKQFEARATAFGEEGRIYGECTVSNEDGRIFQEINVKGSGSKFYVQCPDCKEYFFPERIQLKGWAECDNVLDARDLVYYECPKCEFHIDEENRRASLDNVVLLHKGQSVNKKGKVTGDLPKTRTLGMQWNCYHAATLKLADIADKMWNAKLTGTVSDEKEISQFYWATPYKDEYDSQEMVRSTVLNCVCDYYAGNLPEEVLYVTCGIDIQTHWIYYIINGWDAEGRKITLDFGSADIVPEEFRAIRAQPSEAEVEAEILLVVNKCDNLGCVRDHIFIDSNYDKEGYIREIADRHNCMPIRGRGHKQMEKMRGAREGKRLKARKWFVPDGGGQIVMFYRGEDRIIAAFLEADTLRIMIHKAYRRGPEEIGGCKLPLEVARLRGNNWFARHICAEQYVCNYHPGRGEEWSWKTKGRHDLLDCDAYSLGAYMWARAGGTNMQATKKKRTWKETYND